LSCSTKTYVYINPETETIAIGLVNVKSALKDDFTDYLRVRVDHDQLKGIIEDDYCRVYALDGKIIVSDGIFSIDQFIDELINDTSAELSTDQIIDLLKS